MPGGGVSLPWGNKTDPEAASATNYLSLGKGFETNDLTDFDYSLFEYQNCSRFTFQCYVVHEIRHFNKSNFFLSRMDHRTF